MNRDIDKQRESPNQLKTVADGKVGGFAMYVEMRVRLIP